MIGTCQIEIEIKGGEILVCGVAGVKRISVLDKASHQRARVDVCAQHLAEHNSQAASRRHLAKTK